jgi:hypothetical protein
MVTISRNNRNCYERLPPAVLLKRSGTLSGNFVTEEYGLGCLEYALRRVDQDAIGLKSIEKCPQMFNVCELTLEGSHTVNNH